MWTEVISTGVCLDRASEDVNPSVTEGFPSLDSVQEDYLRGCGLSDSMTTHLTSKR